LIALHTHAWCNTEHSVGAALGFTPAHKQESLLSVDFTGPDSQLDYSGNHDGET